MKECLECKGSGVTREYRPCIHCEGKGYFPPPDYLQIALDISTSTRGDRRRFRRSPPPIDRSTIRGARAYYVWRLARFHGGADVTMPVVACAVIHADPYKDELDLLAEAVARKVFGTDLAAAYRWGQALGYDLPEVPGLPPTAYRNGPAMIEGDKPLDEILELL